MADCCGARRCKCTLVAGPGVEIGGGGSTSNPYIISAGGGTGTPTVIQAGDTTTVDTTVTGTGTTADPVVVSSVVRLDATPPGGSTNLIQSGPDGLSVELAKGCGLDGDGTAAAPLAAAVGTWGYACDVDANAGQVYCDSTGTLRSEPRGRVVYNFSNDNETFPGPAVPSSEAVVLSRSLDIVNPDACRPAVVLVQYEADVDFYLPAGAGAAYGINGDEMVHLINRGSGLADPEHVQTLKITRINIPAGETRTATLEVSLDQGTGGAEYTRIQWSIKYFLFVL